MTTRLHKEQYYNPYFLCNIQVTKIHIIVDGVITTLRDTWLTPPMVGSNHERWIEMEQVEFTTRRTVNAGLKGKTSFHIGSEIYVMIEDLNSTFFVERRVATKDSYSVTRADYMVINYSNDRSSAKQHGFMRIADTSETTPTALGIQVSEMQELFPFMNRDNCVNVLNNLDKITEIAK